MNSLILPSPGLYTIHVTQYRVSRMWHVAHRSSTRVNSYRWQSNLGVEGGRVLWWSSLKLIPFASAKIVIGAIRACMSLLKTTEKQILIILVHENTPHFPFFKTFEGLLPPMRCHPWLHTSRTHMSHRPTPPYYYHNVKTCYFKKTAIEGCIHFILVTNYCTH